GSPGVMEDSVAPPSPRRPVVGTTGLRLGGFPGPRLLGGVVGLALAVLLAEELDHRVGRVLAGHAIDAGDRVGARSGQEQPWDRRPVAGQPRGGTARPEPGDDRVDVV